MKELFTSRDIYFMCVYCACANNKFYPGWPEWSVHVENLHPAQARSRQKQARSRLGGLVRLSYDHILFLHGFLRNSEISPRRASPVNRDSPPPYEQPLRINYLLDNNTPPSGKMRSKEFGVLTSTSFPFKWLPMYKSGAHRLWSIESENSNGSTFRSLDVVWFIGNKWW